MQQIEPSSRRHIHFKANAVANILARTKTMFFTPVRTPDHTAPRSVQWMQDGPSGPGWYEQKRPFLQGVEGVLSASLQTTRLLPPYGNAGQVLVVREPWIYRKNDRQHGPEARVWSLTRRPFSRYRPTGLNEAGHAFHMHEQSQHYGGKNVVLPPQRSARFPRQLWEALNDPDGIGDWPKTSYWRHPEDLPDNFSPCWIRVASVRPQRLNEVTEEQASRDLGLSKPLMAGGEYWGEVDRVDIFRRKWDQRAMSDGSAALNWDQRPWVWAYEFEVVVA